MTDNELFKNAISEQNIEKVKIFLKDENIDPSENENHSIRIAIMVGSTEIVKLLLEGERIQFKNRINILYIAATQGHIDIVKLLLNDPRINPAMDNNLTTRHIVGYNQPEILELLWGNEKIKSTLQQDDYELYSELTKQDIKNKISEF
jgi:ankyrin repeat protein